MEDIKFDVTSDQYPEVLFEGESEREIVNFIANSGIIFNSVGVTAQRRLSEPEINEIRGNYIHLMEDIEPVLTNELFDKTEEQKKIVNEAKDKLQACKTQIHDYVSQVKRGVVDYEIGMNHTYRIAIDGKYLFYANIENRLMLVKIANIPEGNDADLFDAQDANGMAFENLK